MRHVSTQENFPRKEKFVKCDWPEVVENFQLLTMIFSENFLSAEIFLEWNVTGGLDKFYTVVHEICRPTKVLETLRFRTATRLQRLPIQ